MLAGYKVKKITVQFVGAESSPWKAITELKRIALTPLFRLYFELNGIGWGKGWLVYGVPIIHRYRSSKITIGDYLQIRNWFGSNPLGVKSRSILTTLDREAEIRIGDFFRASGVSICAQELVLIGNNVRIGANSTIVDTDFHPIDPEERLRFPQNGKSRAVVIEDNVFVGTECLILKGTRLGQGSVVGGGSVVTGDFPANVIIAGNPAKVIQDIN